MKKIIVNLLRFAFAAVFIFSGYVKLIDPLGFTYKIQEYLENFGGFFQMFEVLAFPAAIAAAAIELIIGINLLLGIYRKQTTILAILFMAVMTPLTLYIALFNPVSDCGCFGDALIIGNWTTFWKNIVLSAIIITLFICRKDIIPFLGRKTRIFAVVYAVIFSVGLSIYSYRHLPLIDFLPYSIGTYIPEKMEYPEDAPRDVFVTILTYKNNETGEQKDFKLKGSMMVETKEKTFWAWIKQLFGCDSKDEIEHEFSEFSTGWTFVAQNSKRIKKGYEPPIHDFSITTYEDGDITEEILEDENYTFLLISPKLEKANLRKSEQINQIYEFAQRYGYKFYALTASLSDDIEDYIRETGAKYPFAMTDETTLKTIIRSNPGLLLLKDGTILNKWHFNDLPNFAAPLETSALGEIQPNHATKKTLIAAVIFFVPILAMPILVLIGFRVITIRKKKSKK